MAPPRVQRPDLVKRVTPQEYNQRAKDLKEGQTLDAPITSAPPFFFDMYSRTLDENNDGQVGSEDIFIGLLPKNSMAQNKDPQTSTLAMCYLWRPKELEEAKFSFTPEAQALLQEDSRLPTKIKIEGNIFGMFPIFPFPYESMIVVKTTKDFYSLDPLAYFYAFGTYDPELHGCNYTEKGILVDKGRNPTELKLSYVNAYGAMFTYVDLQTGKAETKSAE